MDIVIRTYDFCVLALAWAAGCILVAILYMVLQDVLLRNLLISPPAWSAPLSEYGLLYITMLCAPWLVRTHGHIALEVVRMRLTRSAARKMELVVYLLCIIACMVVTAVAAELWSEALASGEDDPRAIAIPRTYLFLPALVAFPLMAVEFSRCLFGKSSLYSGEPVSGESV